MADGTTKMTYPTIEQVETAGVEAVLRWNRFLPSPRTQEQVDVIDAIVARLRVLQDAKPEAYVAASKSIGW